MSERWMPKHGEYYYFVDSLVCIGGYGWRDDSTDRSYYEIGNCFKTKAEAEAAAEKVKALLVSLHDSTQDKPLPKLTAEVFDRPDCPEWAKYAMVNDLGYGYWYEANPGLFICGYGQGTRVMFIDRFDSSGWQNSLIERPEKTTLPEWCKPGEWVWAIAFNAYFKVGKVDGLFISGTDFSGSEYCVAIENVRQVKPRPYNAEEMPGLLGKVVSNAHGDMFLVTAFIAGDGGEVCVDGVVYSADDLFEYYTINGKPCGVLEHLDEKGEWVK